jgi:hypothetical protein
MRLILPLLLLTLALNSTAQNKYDYIWHLGQSALDSFSFYPASVLDFNTNPPSSYIIPRKALQDAEFGSICDPHSGQTLFYSNGAYIADSSHQVVLNGDTLINDTSFILMNTILGSRTLEETIYWGLSPIKILPRPGDPYCFDLFQLSVQFLTRNETSFASGLRKTEIRINPQTRQVYVTEKARILIQDTLQENQLQTIRHANGRDWWILVPEMWTNCYYIGLYDSTGQVQFHKECMGDINRNGTGYWLGQAIVSSDGRLVAFSDHINGVRLFDFDRCQGTFLRHRYIQTRGIYRWPTDGACFSFNDRFLYLGGYDLHQLDLHAPSIAASAILIDSTDFSSSCLGGVYMFQKAPNGKIYAVNPNSNRLHIIHAPDSLGAACRFEPCGLVMPSIHGGPSLGFPDYRMGPLDTALCGQLVQPPNPVATVSSPHSPKAQILPNPNRGHFEVRWLGHSSFDLRILDAYGRVLFAQSQTQAHQRLDLQHLAQGTYFVLLKDQDQQELLLWIKQE